MLAIWGEVPMTLGVDLKKSSLAAAGKKLPLSIKFYILTNSDAIKKGTRLSGALMGPPGWVIR